MVTTLISCENYTFVFLTVFEIHRQRLCRIKMESSNKSFIDVTRATFKKYTHLGPARPLRWGWNPHNKHPFLDALLNRTNGRLRQRVPFRRFYAFRAHHPGLTLSLACVKYSLDFGHDLILPIALGLSRWLPFISICFHVHEQICSNRATSTSNKPNARFQWHLQF